MTSQMLNRKFVAEPQEIEFFKGSLNEDNGASVFTSPPKILLLEDTPIIQLVNGRALTALGCVVDLAKTGEECLAKFQQGYDLVFLDIGLPDIRGSMVAQYIRSLEKELGLKRNILIALTAFGEEVREECETAGVDALYGKPITQNQLREVLLTWLPKSLVI